MKKSSVWQWIAAVVVAGSGVVAACSSHKNPDTTPSSALGESTAPAPGTPVAQDPPAPEEEHTLSDPPRAGAQEADLRTAQAEPAARDAGIGGSAVGGKDGGAAGGGKDAGAGKGSAIGGDAGAPRSTTPTTPSPGPQQPGTSQPGTYQPGTSPTPAPQPSTPSGTPN
jgi:hypothetical protein